MKMKKSFVKGKVGDDQEMAQSETIPTPKHRGGLIRSYTKKTYCKPNGQPFSQ